MTTIILDQLSYRFSEAYIGLDELWQNQFTPLNIQKYHIGWLAPHIWQILSKHGNIFHQNAAMKSHFSNPSIDILKSVKDLHIRNDFFQKLQKYLLKHKHISNLSHQHFAIQSPLGDDLLHIDRSCATFLGIPMPLVSLTPYFKKNGEYYYWLSFKAGKWHVFDTQVLRVQETIHHALSDICDKAKIKSGSAMLVNHLATRRITPIGLHWQEIDNYILELPESFQLQRYNSHRKIQAFSSNQLIDHFFHLNQFHFESSILLANILQKHQKIEQLSDGMKFAKKSVA
jgi:hypothetical protein